MKLKSKITQSLLLGIIIAYFTACGDNGCCTSDVDNNKILNISTLCITNPTLQDIDKYMLLQSGDTIIKDEPNTLISIYHDINNIKRVCQLSGSAHILRK